MGYSSGLTKDQYTIAEHILKTTDGQHELYVQEWGNPTGTPILFLHGGPGSGCGDNHKNLFDPRRHRAIFIDQRGSGRSLPVGSLENNNTDSLTEDVELLRTTLGIEQLVITGGSWGSTLALRYAIAHPDRVTGLVIRGIFLGTQSETDWIDQGHFRTFFPEVWEEFLNSTPEAERHDAAGYHQRNVKGDDPDAAKRSSHAYGTMEYGILSLDDRPKHMDFETFDPASTQIEMHFLNNQCFMSDDFIINNADKLKMPVHIVQGRYDVICTPEIAYRLHKTIPHSNLYWTIAGHSGSDRANFDTTKAVLAQF